MAELLDPSFTLGNDDSSTLGTIEQHVNERAAVPAMASPTGNRGSESSLRDRFLSALRELATCQDLLASHGIEYDRGSFSCNPEDHADVLSCEDSLPANKEDEDHAEPADDLGLPVRPLVVQDQLPRPPSGGSDSDVSKNAELSTATPAVALAEVAPEVVESEVADGVASTASVSPGIPVVETSGAPLVASQVAAATPFQIGESAGGELTGDTGLASVSREKDRLEEELSMAKALLMLNNVNVNMDFDQEDGPVGTAAEVVNLKGSRHLIQLLLSLKQKVSLLHQQYILLRGDMLYLNHEMNVCRHWILQSFRMAMQHQSQEHSSLQTRFERLSKVLA